MRGTRVGCPVGAFAAILLLFAVTPAARAQDAAMPLAPGVEQTVAPAVVRIGDSIHVTITGPPATTLSLPPLADSLGAFTVLGSQIVMAAGRPQLHVHLAAFDVGSLEIPSFDVPVDGGAAFRTRPYRITVESLLPADSAAVDTMTIRPAHAPFELPQEFRWRVALGYLLVLLALGLLGWWLYRWWKNRPVKAPVVVAAPVVVRPADVVALESLEALMARGYALRGLFKEHYTEAMDILRVFIEQRLKIEALDRTSFELRRELTRHGVGTRTVSGLAALLEQADLVKFARQTPTVESSVALVEAARIWVRETHAEATAREAMTAAPPASAATVAAATPPPATATAATPSAATATAPTTPPDGGAV